MQCILVRRKNAAHRRSRRSASDRQIVESALPCSLVKDNHRRQDAAAEESPAVIVVVKAEIESGAKGVCSVHPTQIINKLWSSYRALSMWGNTIRGRNVSEGPDNTLIAPRRQLIGVAKVRVRFAKGEIELEAIESSGELIHQVRREHMTMDHSQILAQAENLS